ncbi:MAG: 3-deoxy-manno-octulosonate cytidylyltransferase [Planctomycetes bacterium]|nr:3-deoxy-manno-octulosonate cytidylyltransferase [Planctomycetota bacterium]
MRAEIVIPARLASTRLPEKLLLAETGMTVLEHTHRAARRSRLAAGITIAVDHVRLANAAEAFGAVFQMTDPNATSGTDRVAEVARSRPDVDVFVNVQGDEPEICGGSIDLAIELLEQNPKADVATLATPIRSKSDLEEPSCVKVVRSHSGLALYFSRSVIPYPRSWDDSLLGSEPASYLQHIGLYAYRRSFLLSLGELLPSPLEQIEKLEQLRFLQSGRSIAVGIVPRSPKGIDTREDYDAFQKRFRQTTT